LCRKKEYVKIIVYSFLFYFATLTKKVSGWITKRKRSLERSHDIGIPMSIRRSGERFFYYSSERMVKMNSIELNRVFDKVSNQVRLEMVNIEMVNRRGKKRIKAEINLQDGTKRYYVARADTKKEALQELLLVIRCIEKETGQRILWRIQGEETYHLGSKSIEEFSLKNKIKKFLEMLFDLEE
jgi:hypothetical protein